MKILVNTSTFKESDDDQITDVINRLVDGINESNEEISFTILKPMSISGKKLIVNDKYQIHCYRYFFINKYQTFANLGIKPSIQKNKLNIIKLIFLLISQFISLNKLVRNTKPDYIYAHWFFPQAVISSIVSKINGVKFIYTSHGSDVQVFNSIGKIGKYLVRKVTNSAYKYTAVSNLTLNEINSNLNKDDLAIDKFQVIPMGIDEKYFEIENKISTNREKVLNFLYIGRLVDYKGVDILLNALSIFKSDGGNFKLDILGNGILENQLKVQTKKLYLDENVNFQGFKDIHEKVELIKNCDLFFVPSIIKRTQLEGGPLTLIETMASGGVCVVSNSVGFSNYCNEKNSLVFESGSEVELNKRINEYSNMSLENLKSIKENAKKDAEFFRFSNISRLHNKFLFSN